MKTINFYLLLIYFSWSLLGCSKINVGELGSSDRLVKSPTSILQSKGLKIASGKLAESAPPKIIRELSKYLERSPQVEIISPQIDETFNSTSVSVKLKVKDLALFKDEQLGLGPHLHLILDNQPYQAVYSTEEPVVLTDLTPGTHTIRVFASRPWHESFKNEGAYAQTSFNILTKTDDNNPAAQIPLLTYSRPTGTYTAEPIMLDFYLTNVPSKAIAKENGGKELQDWRIRVTINGESFILDRWQPVYLSGFVLGNNWVQLELIDKNGNNIDNVFNNIVRLVNYKPNAEASDTLAKLVTGQISAVKAHPIIEQNYYIQPLGEPEIIEPKIIEPPEVTEPKEETTVSLEKTTEELESVIEDGEQTNLSAPTETNINLVEPEIDNDRNVTEEITTPETTTTPVSQPEEAIALAVKTEPDSSVVVEVKPSDSESVSVKVTEEEEAITVNDRGVEDGEKAIAVVPEVETVETVETSPTEITPSSQPQASEFKLPAWVNNFQAKLQQTSQDISHFLSELVTTIRIKTVELLNKLIEAIN